MTKQNAEHGVRISGEVANSFEAIAVSSKKVNDLIAEIAAASKEQSQGIDQLNNAVAQMDKVTQQNAANSEESAGSAEELSTQAEELQKVIAQFTLSATGEGSRPIRREKTLRLDDGHRRYGTTKPVYADPETIIPMKSEVLGEF